MILCTTLDMTEKKLTRFSDEEFAETFKGVDIAQTFPFRATREDSMEDIHDGRVNIISIHAVLNDKLGKGTKHIVETRFDKFEFVWYLHHDIKVVHYDNKDYLQLIFQTRNNTYNRNIWFLITDELKQMASKLHEDDPEILPKKVLELLSDTEEDEKEENPDGIDTTAAFVGFDD